mmetsp:Transcript_25459/g.75249  ORF Transcript_25459/g.75249 Transcript_25459/m.75249 type:complete len:571 (-) Transcript_25459:525-2237(-)
MELYKDTGLCHEAASARQTAFQGRSPSLNLEQGAHSMYTQCTQTRGGSRLPLGAAATSCSHLTDDYMREGCVPCQAGYVGSAHVHPSCMQGEHALATPRLPRHGRVCRHSRVCTHWHRPCHSRMCHHRSVSTKKGLGARPPPFPSQLGRLRPRPRAACIGRRRLDDNRRRTAAAVADGGDADASATDAQHVEQRDEDTRAARADGVPKRNAASVCVDALGRKLHQLPVCEVHHREGLVDLPEVDVAHGQASAVQRFRHRERRRRGEPLWRGRGVSVRAHAREHWQAERGGLCAAAQHERCCAVSDRACITGCHGAVAVLCKHGAQPRQLRQVHLGGPVICGNDASVWKRHRHHLPSRVAYGGCRIGACVALRRVRVLVGPAEAVLRCAHLCACAHVHLAVRIPQPVLDQPVHHLAMPHAQPLAAGRHVVRYVAHRLHAPGDDDVGGARADRLVGQHDRLKAARTHLVDDCARDRVGQPRGQHRLRGRRLPEIGAAHVPHEHLVHVRRLHTGALYRGPHGDAAQLRRRERRERALEAAERRAHRRNDDRLPLRGVGCRGAHGVPAAQADQA